MPSSPATRDGSKTTAGSASTSCFASPRESPRRCAVSPQSSSSPTPAAARHRRLRRRHASPSLPVDSSGLRVSVRCERTPPRSPSRPVARIRGVRRSSSAASRRRQRSGDPLAAALVPSCSSLCTRSNRVDPAPACAAVLRPSSPAGRCLRPAELAPAWPPRGGQVDRVPFVSVSG